ncbi:MAG: mannitol-1-phosphate 5-dehydrogenase [Candidatus Hydrogenedentes bacterium]|nr:mannitol-1-phosphate 5-dehydrogenase [Candidatus Hydrogenedentota bacterium]
MRKAVQFGAGNIGRGFLGQLFYESGYETTFVDVADALVAGLNDRHSYPLRILDDVSYTMCIENVRAVHATKTDAVAKALAGAEIAATAVGVPVLPKIAHLIAAGIEQRFADFNATPLNVIVCENLLDAGPYLREQVRGHLSPTFHAVLDEKVGFVEASIGRMVPVMTETQRQEDPLLVCVEEYCHLPVDKDGFKGPIPELKNLQPRDNFAGYVERKLFVHNAGHAVAAYLGYLKGYEYIWQAVGDPAVRTEIETALAESCEGLARKHGMDVQALRKHTDDLLRRFGNRLLGDQVERVARDPIRKLGPRDRLIGAATMCLEQGVSPLNLAFAAAAAIRYDHPSDPAAQSIQERLAREGLSGVLREVCTLDPDSILGCLVASGIRRLDAEGWIRA